MMVLDLVCFDCINEQLTKQAGGFNNAGSIPTPFEQVNNTGIYEVKCTKGHHGKTIIDNIDFEILFDYGLNAIIDGYYREAVSSLTAALERFYEFFIKTILCESKVDWVVVDSTWKIVSSQSERQMGAFVFLYCQAFKKQPQTLSTQKDIPFRNNVIHKGYIPKEDEAKEYATKILTLIENTLIELKQTYPDATISTYKKYGYLDVAQQAIREKEEKSGVEENYAVVNIMTIINVNNGREINPDDGRNGTLEQVLLSIVKGREPRKLTIIKKPADI